MTGCVWHGYIPATQRWSPVTLPNDVIGNASYAVSLQDGLKGAAGASLDETPLGGLAFITPPGQPAAPTGVTATVGDGQTEIALVAPKQTGGGTLSDVRAAAMAEGETPQLIDLSLTATPDEPARFYVDGLTNNVRYTLEVWVERSQGSGLRTTVHATPSAVPTAAVLDLTGRDGGYAIKLDAPPYLADGDLDPVVHQRTAGDTTWTSATLSGATLIREGFEAEVNVTKPGDVYEVRAAWRNPAGTGAFSSASVPTYGAPGPIENATVRRNGSEITVAFDPPSRNGGAKISHFDVRVQPFKTKGRTHSLESLNTPTATFTELDLDTTYILEIDAFNVRSSTPSTAALQVAPDGTVSAR